MLKNCSYIGEHIEGGTMFDCPQFVEREVFEGVQKMFSEAKLMQNGRPPRRHPLSGYLRCRKCMRRYGTVPNGGYPAYVSGNLDRQRKRLCDCQRISCKKADPAAFGAIWRLLTQHELLFANARAYFDSLPSKGGTERLEKELATVTAQMERTKRMVRAGAEDEDKGTALILEDKRRIAEIEAELRAAGSVITLPPARVIEAACRRIAEGPEPQTFEERRPILEKLVDLVITYGNNELEITGKVPVPEVEASGGNSRKCNTRLDADSQGRASEQEGLVFGADQQQVGHVGAR